MSEFFVASGMRNEITLITDAWATSSNTCYIIVVNLSAQLPGISGLTHNTLKSPITLITVAAPTSSNRNSEFVINLSAKVVRDDMTNKLHNVGSFLTHTCTFCD